MIRNIEKLLLVRTDSGCTALFVNQTVVAEANTTAEIDRLVVKTAQRLSTSLGIPLVECTVEVPDELDDNWEWADLYTMLQPVAAQLASQEAALVADDVKTSRLSQLKDAYEAAPPDWFVVPACAEDNTEGKYIEIHDGFGRTATVYGELDAENVATAKLMALSQNLMPLLLEAVEIVRSTHEDNAQAVALLAVLDR